jgi:GntR family transcriptional regulator
MDSSNILENFKLSADGMVSLYSQLADYFRYCIKSGVLKPGDKMIAETEVASKLQISRTTVRLAFDELVKEGLVVRHRGKGSFVSEPRLRRNINYLYNFTENIREAGSVPSSLVMRCEVIDDNQEEQERLHLETGDKRIFLLERQRVSDGKPLIIETTYIPYYLCPGIERYDFSVSSLYAILKGQYELNICHAEESIEAIILDNKTSSILGCKGLNAGYHIERYANLPNGYICEHTTSITRADMCMFKLDLYSNDKTKEHSIDFERQMKLKTE